MWFLLAYPKSLKVSHLYYIHSSCCFLSTILNNVLCVLMLSIRLLIFKKWSWIFLIVRITEQRFMTRFNWSKICWIKLMRWSLEEEWPTPSWRHSMEWRYRRTVSVTWINALSFNLFILDWVFSIWWGRVCYCWRADGKSWEEGNKGPPPYWFYHCW